MSIAIAKGLYGIGAKGPQDRRRRQMEDEQFEREGERHDLSMERGELGIEATKQDMEYQENRAEREETQFDWEGEDRAEIELARRTQKDLTQAMYQWEVEGNLQPLINSISSGIKPISGYTDTKTPEGKAAVTIQFKDETTRTIPINSYVDEKGNTHVGLLDLTAGVAKQDPSVIPEIKRQLGSSYQEAQEAATKHDREIQERLASRVPGERVQADEEGNLSVMPAGSEQGERLFEFGLMNTRDIDPQVVARAERHYQETGDYAGALEVLSEGASSQRDKAVIERIAEVPTLVEKLLPPDGLGNPVKQYIRQKPNDAEKYGISEDDTYGEAFAKIQDGLINDMGLEAPSPTLGIGRDRGRQQETPAPDEPGGSARTAVPMDELPDDRPPADGTYIRGENGRIGKYNAQTQKIEPVS